jgi:hypothetical protein
VQVGTVGLEALDQPVALIHRSHFLVAVRYHSDGQHEPM